MPKEEITPELTKTEQSYLRRALRLAETGTCNQRHGAIIVKGGRVLSVGINTQRNTPADSIPYEDVAVHAEEAALRAIGGQARGAKIYVARKMKDGSSGLSRPCDRCYRAIKDAGIKEIIYTDYNTFKSA